jgi:hypothetical protein
VSLEIAGVVDAAGGGFVWQPRRGDEIAGTHRVGWLFQFARDVVHQTLDHVGRLGPSGAPIGVDRDRVRVVAADPGVNCRNVVKARRHKGAVGRHERTVLREIGAEIGLEIDAQAEKAPAGVEGHLGRRDIVAPLRVADEMLGPLGEPFHRALQPLGRDRA